MDKVQQRRDRIVEMLKAAPMVTIAELATCQHVTTETIRKDLRALEKQGVITKIHGGAALTQKRIAPFPYYMRESVDREEKTRIAGAAYALINKGDSLLIESSTTTVLLCQEMLQHQMFSRHLQLLQIPCTSLKYWRTVLFAKTYFSLAVGCFLQKMQLRVHIRKKAYLFFG